MIKKYTNNVEQLLMSEQKIQLKLRIDEDLFWFNGHFDQYPILAGVVQVDWVIHYFHQFMSSNKVFDGLVNVKFQQPIIPNEEIILTIEHEKDKNYLLFQYEAKDVKSKGRMRLK